MNTYEDFEAMELDAAQASQDVTEYLQRMLVINGAHGGWSTKKDIPDRNGNLKSERELAEKSYADYLKVGKPIQELFIDANKGRFDRTMTTLVLGDEGRTNEFDVEPVILMWWFQRLYISDELEAQDKWLIDQYFGGTKPELVFDEPDEMSKQQIAAADNVNDIRANMMRLIENKEAAVEKKRQSNIDAANEPAEDDSDAM